MNANEDHQLTMKDCQFGSLTIAVDEHNAKRNRVVIATMFALYYHDQTIDQKKSQKIEKNIQTKKKKN